MSRFIPTVLQVSSFLFLLWWHRIYFTAEPIASVDLPSFITIAAQLREHLQNAKLSFYDPGHFTGYPALHFYGFFPALVAAVFSFPFELISSNAITLAVHLLLVIGVALIPASIYYVLLAIVDENTNLKNKNLSKSIAALCSITFGFWFINHDHQYFGVGAAAPMNIGLFSQLFALHFILIAIGSTMQGILVPNFRNWILICLSFSLLILSHPVSVPYLILVILLILVANFEQARKLGSAYICGFALAGFWAIPCLIYAGKYTAFDPQPPEGDFLKLFLRYPLLDLLSSIPIWIKEVRFPISLLDCLIPIILLCGVFSRLVRQSNLIAQLTFALLVSIVLFSSQFFQSSLPFALHFYRMQGLNFLLATIISAAVFLKLTQSKLEKQGISRILVFCFASLLMIASFLSCISLPHYERALIKSSLNQELYRDEHEVLNYFKAKPEKGRVYFEYLPDYSVFPPLSAHLMDSNVYRQTGFESSLNSHVQESIAYRMMVVSAKLLGANTYNTPLLFTDRSRLSRTILVDQLKEFGITHVVAGTERLAKNVEAYASSSPIPIGKYRIIPLSKDPLLKIQTAKKPLIGFLDLNGNIPFRFLEFYCYARTETYLSFDLIEISNLKSIPPNLSGIIVNGALNESQRQSLNDIKIVNLDYSPTFELSHYDTKYPHNIELRAYNTLERYLMHRVDFENQTLLLASTNQNLNSSPEYFQIPLVSWNAAKQTFTIKDLIPEKLYRLNYSYFPYWSSNQADIFRGSLERIFFVPHASEVSLNYSAWSCWPAWAGSALSLLAIFYIVWHKIKCSNSPV